MQWFRRAADRGLAAAENNIGLMYMNGWGVAKDYTLARQWYERATDKRNGPAQRNIAYLYENGLGVPKDPVEARRWMERAARDGSQQAKDWLEKNPGQST